MVRRAEARFEHTHQLPPRDLRADGFKDPNSPDFTKLPTPLTESGLVDKTRLIKLVRSTLNSAYNWPSELDDEHHLQWPRRNYAYLPDQPINPYEFRNLAANKVYWPRTFHNWTHKITEPPPVPSLEVMNHTIQAQLAIDSLHRCAQIAKMLTRNHEISTHSLSHRLSELYDSYNESLDDIVTLPQEFHFVDPNEYRPRTIEDLLNVGGGLGRLATISTVSTATRHIRQTTHKSLVTVT